MATEPRHRRGRAHGAQRGAITLVALCLTTTLGIALASYLALTSRSAEFSNRTSLFDQAHQLAQVGLEEALWALNQNPKNWSASGPDGNTAWSVSGANQIATLTYPLSGAGASARVVLTVANYTSTGPMWPTITAAATITVASGQTFRRTLQADTGPAPLFSNAIASAKDVTFIAGGFVDSWNSVPESNPSGFVPYPTPLTPKDPANYRAVVAGNNVALGQATVQGYAATFGNDISTSTSAPGQRLIGPKTLTDVKIDAARIGKSAFVPSSDVFTVTIPPHSGSNSTGLLGSIEALLNAIFNHDTSKDTFHAKDITVHAGLPLLGLLSTNITVTGKIKIFIEGDLTINNGGVITIEEDAALELYVTGNLTIEGNGFDNKTNDPKKLAIFCTGTSTTPVVYDTDADFCGVIYSVNKPIKIKKNGPFYGAFFSGEKVEITATNPQFHYDTALRNARFSDCVTTPYIVKKVTEL